MVTYHYLSPEQPKSTINIGNEAGCKKSEYQLKSFIIIDDLCSCHSLVVPTFVQRIDLSYVTFTEAISLTKYHTRID